ncbi:MAG: efflux RND transporter periplasmic adaptor subunit [SAR324 cluster bacterium]|nr:efflux RND transporter periplasmic adaptor subunit [SAR324 cluster bacterium]
MYKYIHILICASFISFLPLTLPAQQKGEKAKRPPVPVVAAAVKEELHSSQIQLTGTLHPLQQAFLSVDDSARIKQVFKHEGDFVKKGELLAQAVNPAQEGSLQIAKIALKQAKIQMDSMERKFKRTKFLMKKQISSQEKLDDDQTNYLVQQIAVESRNAEIHRLSTLVDSYSVKAPFDGQIISSSAEIGMWTTPSHVLYQIVNYDVLELKLGVPGKFLGEVLVGGLAHVQVGNSTQKREGTITSVVNHVEGSTGNFLVEIHVANPEKEALSGLLAQATIPIGKPMKKLLVPRDAIVRRGDRTHVVVVREGIAQIIPVQVKGNQKELVVIEAKSLKPGEQVVIRGNERIFPGTPVTINKDIPVQ